MTTTMWGLKLSSGREVQDDMGIDSDGYLLPVDRDAAPVGGGLSNTERAELAAIMVERWTSFGGGHAVVAEAMEERRAFEAAEEAEMERRELEHAEHRAARVEHVNRPARGTGGDAVMAMDRKTLEAKRAARFAARKRGE